MLSVWDNVFASVSVLSWWERAFFWLLVRESSWCWKSVTVGAVTSRLAGAAGEPKVDVPLKSCSFQVKLKYILILVLSFGSAQSVTALWKLSFLNLASVILTSVPSIHLRFQAFPGCSGCCQCSFRIEWLIKYLLVLGGELRASFGYCSHISFFGWTLLCQWLVHQNTVDPTSPMGEGSRKSYCCLGNSCSWILQNFWCMHVWFSIFHLS